MADVSFKSMIKAGDIKRADAMKVLLADIHEEPGFNLRREGEDLEASIDALAAYIADGGIYPPLEVRPRADGGVWVVDGHRRRRALLKIADRIADGSGDVWVNIVAFNGNDADRVARIITSAEGRALSPLEVAEGYKRLTAFGWSPDQIAQKVGRTRQHVDQMLILARANSDVHTLVASGTVSATVAIDAARKHGEGAGAFLADATAQAQAAGKKRATATTIKGKALPRKLSDELATTAAEFIASLPIEAHQAMATMKLSDVDVDPVVQVSARRLWELLAVNNAIGEFREEQAAKAREAAANENQADIEDAA